MKQPRYRLGSQAQREEAMKMLQQLRWDFPYLWRSDGEVPGGDLVEAFSFQLHRRPLLKKPYKRMRIKT